MKKETEKKAKTSKKIIGNEIPKVIIKDGTRKSRTAILIGLKFLRNRLFLPEYQASIVNPIVIKKPPDLEDKGA